MTDIAADSLFAKAEQCAAAGDVRGALRACDDAVVHAERMMGLREDYPGDYETAGRALVAKARILARLGDEGRAEMTLREGYAAYNKGMGLTTPGSEEWKPFGEKVAVLLRELTWFPPPGAPSDLKAKAEYNRIGMLTGLVPIQRAADWLDSEVPGWEGSEPVSSRAVTDPDPRAYVARRLQEVPGWCTKGLPAKALLGRLALGLDEKMYSPEEFVEHVERLYEGGFLLFDEAPYHGVVLRKVRKGISPIPVLRMALDPHVPIMRRFNQTGQLES